MQEEVSMRYTERTKGKVLAMSAVVGVVLLLFSGIAAAQSTVIELSNGSSDDLVAPPSPTCSDDALILIPEVEFTSVAMPIDADRLGVGGGLVESFDIEDFPTLDPGVIDLTQIITYDGHLGRAGWPAQDNERVAIEFLLDGEIQATSGFTPDVADNVSSAWVIADLGEIDLPEGADAARVIHWGEEFNDDSVVVASLCAEFTAVEVLDETAGDAAADDAAADDDDDEVEGLTLAELIERNTGASNDELALTGANEIAFGIIALGVILFGIAMKVQGQDPEELTY